MGADWIQKAAPSFKKSWDRARVALGTGDMFTRTPTCAAYSAPFDMAENARLKVGEHVMVEKDGRGLVARRGLSEVACIENPPAELLCRVEEACGIAKGTVEQVHQLSRVAEISLC